MTRCAGAIFVTMWRLCIIRLTNCRSASVVSLKMPISNQRSNAPAEDTMGWKLKFASSFLRFDVAGKSFNLLRRWFPRGSKEEKAMLLISSHSSARRCLSCSARSVLSNLSSLAFNRVSVTVRAFRHSSTSDCVCCHKPGWMSALACGCWKTRNLRKLAQIWG